MSSFKLCGIKVGQVGPPFAADPRQIFSIEVMPLYVMMCVIIMGPHGFFN